MELHSDSRFWTTNYEVIHLTDRSNVHCIACSACRKCLPENHVFLEGGKKFCWQCYEDAFALKCTSCFHSIKGLSKMSFVFFNGRVWHRGCFRCSVCRKPLEGEQLIEGKGSIFCQRCGEGQMLIIG